MWRGIFSRRDPLDTIEKVDRQRYYQNRRLICGLNLNSSLDQVTAALVLVEGCGHWLNLQVANLETEAVPSIIAESARELTQAAEIDVVALADLKADLNEVYSQLIWRLKAGAGKAADHVLAAAIDDPGIWIEQEETRRYVDSFCAPDALAEKCALTIIDALPARDVAVGGYGYPLSPLPFWYLFADRNEKISRIGRFVFCFDDSLDLIYLPPSDGLDRESPAVQWSSLVFRGSDWIRNHSAAPAAPAAPADPAAQGCQQTPFESAMPMVKSFVDSINDSTASEFEVVLTGKSALDHLQNVCEALPTMTPVSSAECGIEPESIRPTLSAIMGISHLDQLPINLPHLTGAESPRILGRITPGKPSNWRRVLMNMSDYRPPAMKLRDAI